MTKKLVCLSPVARICILWVVCKQQLTLANYIREYNLTHSCTVNINMYFPGCSITWTLSRRAYTHAQKRIVPTSTYNHCKMALTPLPTWNCTDILSSLLAGVLFLLKVHTKHLVPYSSFIIKGAWQIIYLIFSIISVQNWSNISFQYSMWNFSIDYVSI